MVLVFYPLDWSPACSNQLRLYQSELEEYERANAQLLCISVDSLYSHGVRAAVRGLTFPLLSDFHPKGQVARQYGVLRDSDGFSERALYIIDYRDMEYDPEAARRVQWWTGGNVSHPTVQILVEPSLDEIDWVLSRHGLM